MDIYVHEIYMSKNVLHIHTLYIFEWAIQYICYYMKLFQFHMFSLQIILYVHILYLHKEE